MGRRNAFVVPNTVQLSLPGGEGEWIEVKEGLTYGEEQRLASAIVTNMTISQETREAEEQQIGLDTKRHAILRILLWVVDWNLEGPNGKRVELSASAIENLKPEIAQEINDVLDEHIRGAEGKGAGKVIEIASAAKS